MTKMAHYQKGQTSPRIGKSSIFSDFRVLLFHHFFGEPKFRDHFCQNFTQMFVKTLSIDLVDHLCHNNPFSRSNEPKASKPPILSISVCYGQPSFVSDPNYEIIFAKNLRRC